jgi:protein-S-isoprenylcysteine O-methyltransferase Ste14
MVEKLYLGLILLFFIAAFAIKNIKTYLSTRQSIKGKSKKLSISILLSTFIYVLIALRITVLKPIWFLEIYLFEFEIIRIMGLIILSIGFIIGIFSLIAMKKSWRVGIKYDQKTKLVSSGVYRISRNPYFLSYYVLILGYIFVYPSLILLVLYVTLVFVFHKMILVEEKYLETMHGDLYLNYKKKVKRYFSSKL